MGRFLAAVLVWSLCLGVATAAAPREALPAETVEVGTTSEDDRHYFRDRKLCKCRNDLDRGRAFSSRTSATGYIFDGVGGGRLSARICPVL
jgi:hypothetical protein